MDTEVFIMFSRLVDIKSCTGGLHEGSVYGLHESLANISSRIHV